MVIDLQTDLNLNYIVVKNYGSNSYFFLKIYLFLERGERRDK